MPFIVEEYRNKYAFTMTVESLGQIRVWQIEGMFLIPAIRRNSETIKHIEGYPFMKVLVSKYATHLNLEDERKKGEPITPEEAEKLSPEEAERIAEEIIRHHEYLFVDRNKPIFKQLPPNEGGKVTANLSERKLDIPRNEGETPSQYLYKLVLALSEREETDWKNAVKGTSELAKMVGGLTSDLAETIADSIKSPDYHITLPPPNPQYKTNQILEDVLENLAHQKGFNEASAKSIQGTATSIEKIEKRVENWEEEAKKSSKQASRYNLLNITIAILALLISLLSLYIAYLSYKAPLGNQSSPPVTSPAPAESPQGEMK